MEYKPKHIVPLLLPAAGTLAAALLPLEALTALGGWLRALSLSGGGSETPTVMEILPLPLREPHILAVAGGAVALLAAGILLRIKKQCKD